MPVRLGEPDGIARPGLFERPHAVSRPRGFGESSSAIRTSFIQPRYDPGAVNPPEVCNMN